MFYKPIFENQLNRKVDTCAFIVVNLDCEDSKLLNYDPRDERGGAQLPIVSQVSDVAHGPLVLQTIILHKKEFFVRIGIFFTMQPILYDFVLL